MNDKNKIKHVTTLHVQLLTWWKYLPHLHNIDYYSCKINNVLRARTTV